MAVTTEGAGPLQTLVRAVRLEGAAAPYDTIHVRVTYPASDAEPVDAVGTLAPAVDLAPFPVVLWSPGMNTDPSYYRWLGNEISRAGFAFVTFTFLGLVPPASVGITPGADLSLARPETFGTGPIGALIAPVLEVVAALNEEPGPLHGRLDLDRIALGGHSAGGTISLNSANHRYFPHVRAVFSYAAHTMASTMLGWPAGTVLPLSGDCPALLMSGTDDGLVAASARFYGEDSDRVDPIKRTFDTLPDIPSAAGSWLVSIEGANHFSIAFPDDGGLPRVRDDLPASRPAEQTRTLIGRVITLFLRDHLRDEPGAGPELAALLAQSDQANARTQ